MMSSHHKSCFCGSGRDYDRCCGLLHQGGKAHDAEALMRSRYCAYVLGLEAYLLATWHPETRPIARGFETERAIRWSGLEIRRHVQMDETLAIVEFVARYKLNGRAYRLHEVSRFVREAGCWFYLDGEFPENA